MNAQLTVNGKKIVIPEDKADMPLLWYLREEIGLKGTKFGCGIGQCGACTVHINSNAARSCTIPVSALQGANVRTIEALAKDDDELHPVQQAWIAIDVPQCGYCQTGQIMAAVALLESDPKPTDEEIEQNMINICRCATYVRIRAAVKSASLAYQEKS